MIIIDFKLILMAGEKLGIPFKLLLDDPLFGYFYYKNKYLYVYKSTIGLNNIASKRLSKYQVYQVLDNKDIPHPKAVVIERKDTNKSAINKITRLSKPWVIKPIDGTLGLGVSVKLTEKSEIPPAIEYARKYNKKILAEGYIEGKNYRILIMDNEIIDVLERIPAYVEADGKSNIEELITDKNKQRKKFLIPEIRVDEELKKNLSDKNLNLNSIPKKKDIISLRRSCNMGAGGETRRIGKEMIHPDNIKMFQEAVIILGLRIGGIDFITPDISKSYKDMLCGINEINKGPMVDIHYFADMKMDNSTCENILRKFFNI